MKRLLFITPCIPRTDGVGIERRGARLLDAIADRFEVHLCVVPVLATSPADGAVDAKIARTLVLDLNELANELAAPAPHRAPRLARFSTLATARRISDWADVGFDALLIQRLYLAPLAHLLAELIGPPERMVLDLDDDEAVANRRLGELLALYGDPAGAAMARIEADRYAALGEAVFSGFDTVALCSGEDQARLGKAHPDARFTVWPNVAELQSERRIGDPDTLRLLFVGALAYLPNMDAVTFLCRRLLPELRARIALPVTLTIAGRAPADAVRTLCAEAGAELVADPTDLAPLYARADVALAPIRAGGGTRIKILEALAYGVPVVASELGAEGLELGPGEIDIVDFGEMASACLALKTDPARAEAMVTAARATIARHYTPEALAKQIRADLNPL